MSCFKQNTVMEMGSSGCKNQPDVSKNASFTNLNAPPSTDSFNGLTFGEKIFFGNYAAGAGAGAGATASVHKSGASASSSSSSASVAAAGGRKFSSGQVPRCQVEGCFVDLSDAKAYYSRHKVCADHSKSPKVIVAGFEQRFCQQCSRFHLLAEFDQGKRSCRRRLAGHNERRRKAPPASYLSTRYSRLSSTVFDNSSTGGGVLVDFGAYARLSARDPWSNPRERAAGNQMASAGRSVSNPWQTSFQNPPSNLYLHGSASGTGFSGSRIPSGECFTGVGVADSTRALSLLSNNHWDSRNQASGLGVNTRGVHLAQPTAPYGTVVDHYPSPSHSSGFKGRDGSRSLQEMCAELGLGQISQPLDNHFSGELELELSQQHTRQYMELDNSRDYGSSAQHTHWSL